MKWKEAAYQDQVLGRKFDHMDSTSYMNRVDKMDRQVVLVEREEERVGWEGEEWVLG